MLELGLQRISKLVTASKLPWRAIHVAGTNGKGSVCAYASSMLKAADVPTGQFTSPHLIDRWDCITINGDIIQKDLFLAIEDEVKWTDKRLNIGATEFELLTATAFEAFTRQKVEVGVVEVGVGGLRDATNILGSPLATVITRIGMDHESLLGSTLGEIATEKAGIMKNGVPCFVDQTNEGPVGETIRICAASQHAGPVEFVNANTDATGLLWKLLHRDRYAPQQQIGIALAFKAVQSALEQMKIRVEPEKWVSAVASTNWPGRLQWLSLSKLTTRMAKVLLDGAHNPQSAEALGIYVDEFVRGLSNRSPSNTAVTWLVAASEGKDVRGIFGDLVHASDRVITVEFGPVDGMPWVTPIAAEELAQQLREHLHKKQSKDVTVRSCADLHSALRQVADWAGEGPLVIAGSLYLAADVLRLLRAHGDPH